MKPFKRAERVKPLLQQEISQILLTEVKDPRVKLVTVTTVKLTDDLRDAKVFVTSLGDMGDREDLLTGLRRATGYIRRELGRRLKLRYIPKIEFIFDDFYDKQERILNLLEDIHAEEEPTDD